MELSGVEGIRACCCGVVATCLECGDTAPAAGDLLGSDAVERGGLVPTLLRRSLLLGVLRLFCDFDEVGVDGALDGVEGSLDGVDDAFDGVEGTLSADEAFALSRDRDREFLLPATDKAFDMTDETLSPIFSESSPSTPYPSCPESTLVFPTSVATDSPNFKETSPSSP